MHARKKWTISMLHMAMKVIFKTKAFGSTQPITVEVIEPYEVCLLKRMQNFDFFKL